MGSGKYAGKAAYRGAVASNYDADRRVELMWEQEQQFVREWSETLPDGASLLDIPTGTGRFLEFFLQRKIHVLAQDISPDMLAEISRLHPGIDSSRLQVSPGDAEHLALPDASVDFVVSWRFLHLVPMPVVGGVLREFRRVCRGTVMVQVFAIETRRDESAVLKLVKAVLRPIARRFRPKVRQPAATTPATPWAHIPSYSHREDQLLAAFGETGFHVQKTHTFDPESVSPTRVYFLTPVETLNTSRTP
jgi:ubiquinone/menaquinone biosynthesis C-methylase UbiE